MTFGTAPLYHILPIRFKTVACQHQEDDPQRKRVAQRTFLVREHTQAFDGEAYSMPSKLHCITS